MLQETDLVPWSRRSPNGRAGMLEMHLPDLRALQNSKHLDGSCLSNYLSGKVVPGGRLLEFLGQTAAYVGLLHAMSMCNKARIVSLISNCTFDFQKMAVGDIVELGKCYGSQLHACDHAIPA
ncbi:hypothetical protein M8818_005972 [Zalaria obscura]|uniref:Uncharacterized protein n=1 Tax=Zalaria obscura TaxID=2024903 RepID=A0ACC3S6N6_9PEZI